MTKAILTIALLTTIATAKDMCKFYQNEFTTAATKDTAHMQKKEYSMAKPSHRLTIYMGDKAVAACKAGTPKQQEDAQMIQATVDLKKETLKEMKRRGL